MAKLNVQQNEISIITVDGQDYISLTDMANARTDDARAADVIKNWIRNRYTIELLGTWEIIHNPDFKVVEFDHFKSQAGLPGFVMSVSDWVEKTNAIGLIVRKGRYGGTYAVRDLAFEFGTAISVAFKLYLIEEFQKLKSAEQEKLGWSAKRETLERSSHIWQNHPASPPTCRMAGVYVHRQREVSQSLPLMVTQPQGYGTAANHGWWKVNKS